MNEYEKAWTERLNELPLYGRETVQFLAHGHEQACAMCSHWNAYSLVQFPYLNTNFIHKPWNRTVPCLCVKTVVTTLGDIVSSLSSCSVTSWSISCFSLPMSDWMCWGLSGVDVLCCLWTMKSSIMSTRSFSSPAYFFSSTTLTAPWSVEKQHNTEIHNNEYLREKIMINNSKQELTLTLFFLLSSSLLYFNYN